MARPPRIFVSHSAHREDDPLAADFLESLNARLSENDEFEALIDRYRLPKEVGANWRDTLHAWMELCDGAVILINGRSLEARSWVRHEASVLTIRKRYDPDFPIIWVCFPPVTLQQVATEFHAQNLIELQAAMVGGNAADALDNVLNKLQQLHDRALPTSGAERIELFVANALKDVPFDVLADIARDRLGEDIDKLINKQDAARRFARILMKFDLPKIAAALIRLPEDVRKAKVPLQILNLLDGNWIDHNALRPIGSIDREPSERRTLAINAQREAICRMYLRRFLCVSDQELPRYLTFVPSTGEDWQNELVEQLAKHLQMKLSGIDIDEAKELLKGNDLPNPLFVCLPEREPDRQEMGKLRQVLPYIVVFVLPGPAVPAGEAPESARSGARFLLPAIGEGKEAAVIKAYTKAKWTLELESS